MDADQPPLKKKTLSSRIYFVIGGFFLFCMALFWSLDASFIYIFLGAAVFFFYLGIRNLPREPQPTSQYSQSTSSGFSGAASARNIFSKRSPFSGKTPSSVRPRKIVVGVFIFVFGIFFLLFIIGLFSDDTGSENVFTNYAKGEQFRWDGQYDSAGFYYRLVLSEEPAHEEALRGYASTLVSQLQYDSALATYDQIIEINPDDPEAYYNKALIHRYKKDWQQSLEQTRALLNDHPDYHEARVLAGDDYYEQEKYDSAIRWYDDAYDHGQRGAWLCHVMGYLYDRKGNTDKAIHLYQEALSFDSTKVEIYGRLGELFPGREGEQYRLTASQLKSKGY